MNERRFGTGTPTDLGREPGLVSPHPEPPSDGWPTDEQRASSLGVATEAPSPAEVPGVGSTAEAMDAGLRAARLDAVAARARRDPVSASQIGGPKLNPEAEGRNVPSGEHVGTRDMCPRCQAEAASEDKTMQCPMCVGAGSTFQHRPGSTIPAGKTQCSHCGGSGRVPWVPPHFEQLFQREIDPPPFKFPYPPPQTATTVYEHASLDGPGTPGGLGGHITPAWSGKGRLTVQVTWEPEG